jgi:hypothetical protein
MNNSFLRVISRPPGRLRPVHDLLFTVRNANQITNLHLAKAQSHVLPPDLIAGLYDPGTFANTTMTHNTRGQISFGEDFDKNLFHLGDIHFNLGTINYLFGYQWHHTATGNKKSMSCLY